MEVLRLEVRGSKFEVCHVFLISRMKTREVVVRLFPMRVCSRTICT